MSMMTQRQPYCITAASGISSAQHPLVHVYLVRQFKFTIAHPSRPLNMLTTTTNKTCQTCVEPKPLTDYRRRWSDRDVRMNVCNSCHYASERARRVCKKQEAIDRIVTDYIRKWMQGEAGWSDFCDCQWKISRLNRLNEVDWLNPLRDLLTERIGEDEAHRAYRGRHSAHVRSA